MDGLSTAASILQIAALAGSFLKSFSRFVEQTRTIADSIHDLYDEVRHLEAALNDLGETFAKRPQQLSFEYRHHDNIHRILKSCRISLEALAQALPQLKDETTPIQRLRLSIQRSLRGERVKEIVHHISSYTRILQLSLSTLSLGELWINRQSQEMILAEVRRINQAIRATHLFSGRTETRVGTPREPPVISTPRPHTPSADDEELKSLDEELRCWLESVDEVAAAVSLSIPEDESTDGRLTISLQTHTSNTTLPTFEDDISDSEHEELDDLSRKLLGLTLENNQKIVRQLWQSGIYFQAAEYQRRGIKICRGLSDGIAREGEQNNGVGDITKQADMREMLADILFDCDTAQADDEVEETLEQLLNHEIEQLETDNTDRQWRLHHKLGRLFARQGKFRKSRKYLLYAFMGRSRADPRLKNLVTESAEMLIKTLQVLQLIDEARGIQSWLEEEFPAGSDISDQPSPRSSPRVSVSAVDDLSSPYMWSKKQGFDVQSPHFGFDVCDSEKGKAPIHLAIEQENFEVLQSMLLNIAHVEQRDREDATPMHLAATTHNKRLCAILLEKGAKVEVLDQKKRSPLHRCQCNSGGVQVAELILNRSPELIDRIDCLDKTALYMACEHGNEKMAAFLLLRGADPNKRGPGHFIPLVRAIDAVAQSRATIRLVKLLLEHGADTRLRDGSGRTAFEAANDAGLAAGEIKKLLSDQSSRRPSAASTASTVNTVNTSSTSSGTDTSTSTRSNWSNRLGGSGRMLRIPSRSQK
ncbi:ankyrin [Xylariaceae sp. AK1471]|nr:ankyrin [Xylariaceae sp. AK1471]